MTDYFDENGRCIPADITGKVQPKVRRYFYCTQPEIDLSAIYQRACRFLGTPKSTFEQFSNTIDALLTDIKSTPSISLALNGTYVPFILPARVQGDLGTDIENYYLPAVEQAYAEVYPDYEFTNHNTVELNQRFTSVSGTRHAELLSQLGQDDVIGLYFPALDGYSLEAARAQIETLPDEFSLAGAAETCSALIACPDLLMRLDGYPPLLWFGAVQSQDPNEGFHLEAYGYNLTFNRRMHLGNADEYWANGLVFTQKSGKE